MRNLEKITLVVLFLISTVVLGAACASSPAPKPRGPSWLLTLDSKPAGAVLQANRAQAGGGVQFQMFGTTPLTTPWRQSSAGEFIKITSGEKSVTVIPQEDQSIFVDFTKDPFVVVGAKVVNQ